MKNQIHLSSRSEARRVAARSNICHRDGSWPGLLLAGCCAVLTGLAPSAQAAVTEAWVQRYSNLVSNSAHQASKVVRDAANDIIVTGNADDGVHGQDMLTIKYSGVDGSVLWQKRYNGSANSDDFVVALAVDRSGNVVVTGSSVGSGDYPDLLTVKYAAADGALLWEKRSNGPANSEDRARAVAVSVDGSGNVVVTGSSGGANSADDFYTAKYAAGDGTLLWEKRYNGPANGPDSATAVAMDGSGNVVVTGSSVGSIDSFGNENRDYYTAKYGAADGALLWEKRYDGGAQGGGNDNAIAVAVDGSGNVHVTGSSYGVWTLDIYTAKYAGADGALLWEQRFAPEVLVGPSVAVPAALALDSSGNLVVTGGTGYKQPSLAYTAKYAATNGALLWEKHGPGNGYGHTTAVAMDGSGNVVVTGFSHNGDPNEGSDFHTAKYAAADGALLWEKRANGPAHYINDQAQAVVVDGTGNVVVIWNSYDSGSQFDSYRAKYAAADGVPLWEKRYNGPAGYINDQARVVAMDGRGNVVVTGSSNNGTNNDYYTAKYGAADGALLWEKRYNGPANSEDYASALVVDGSGNVVVTGASGDWPNFINPDYYTAKYAAADGALLWEKRYDGPANGYDFANSLAVDGNGNVVVTGYSYSSSTNADYYTAKYAAADGALLWEKRYNGPGNSFDQANAVAVDGSGDVVVTGFSASTNVVPYNFDCATIKYSGAGVPLWTNRYKGPVNSRDQANAVAVDLSGNVVVTGMSAGSIDSFGNYYTAKYAATNGALLWEKHDPGNGYGHATAVAMDGSGNVVVTGMSYGSGRSNGDFYTAKYAAADGALLWEKRYNGPGNSFDQANAVAVDGNGDVVVTGFSYNGTNTDYYTAKYAAANGALLWEKRYNGPANGDDYMGGSHSLALGLNGMVAITGASDGNFGSGSTANFVTILYRENLPPVSVALVSTGIRLRFAGVLGSSYRIERAAVVTGPWSTLATLAASTDGIFEYVDINQPSGTAFYRTSAP